MVGKEYCHIHGGKTPTGAGLPQTKHGRYSKYLPERLAERYQEAISDSDLISLRDELALIDCRIGDVVSSIDTGESGPAWVALSSLWHDYQNAPEVDASKYEVRISDLLNKGLSERHAWTEVFGLAEQRRKLADGERRRLVDMQQMVTTERVMAFVAAVVAAVRRHVDEPETLAAISADITRLVHQDGGRIRGGFVS